MNLNKATLIGTLGRDPETRSTQSGTKVANLRLATNKKFKKNDEWTEITTWHTIIVWNDRLIEMIERKAQKGSLVYVEGEITEREWSDKEGNQRRVTEIVVDRFNGTVGVLARGRDAGDGNADRSAYGADSKAKTSGQGGSQPDGKADGFSLDDEIPF
jgi:single-strand DNA-binding protein